MTQTLFEFPGRFGSLGRPARYKVYYGGRGGAKSWMFARALLLRAVQQPLRVLCAREFQISIADSVHKLLSDQIETLGLSPYFEVTKTEIRCPHTGSTFAFRGLHHNATEIKSFEGVDICWVEEAQRVSNDSWDLLIPTIRKEGSEIWISFNPEGIDDPTYKRFVVNPMPGSIVRKVGFDDNPWFPDTLRAEMEHCRKTDPDKWAHVWGGNPKIATDAQVLRGRFKIDEFEPGKDWHGPYYGVDWGYANDPTVMVRCWVAGRRLYIDREAYKVGVEIDNTPALFDLITGAREYESRADNARPETISYMRRNGYPRMRAAEKWPGSVEDGVEHLRSYEQIVIHPDCKHAAEEARLWSYKTDRLTGEVQPVLKAGNDHCWDAVRYALSPIIRRRASSVEPLKIF